MNDILCVASGKRQSSRRGHYGGAGRKRPEE